MAEGTRFPLWLLGYPAMPSPLWASDPSYPMLFAWSWVVLLEAGFNRHSTPFWRENCSSPDRIWILTAWLQLSQGCLGTSPLHGNLADSGSIAGLPHLFSIARRSLSVRGWCLYSQSCFIYFCLRLPLFPETSKHDLSTYSLCLFTLALVTKPPYLLHVQVIKTLPYLLPVWATEPWSIPLKIVSQLWLSI